MGSEMCIRDRFIDNDFTLGTVGNVTKYYFLRHVNTEGIVGPFSPVATGTTAVNTSVILPINK